MINQSNEMGDRTLPTIPIPKFNGTSDVNMFLATVEYVRNSQKWPEDYSKFYLYSLLEGTAAAVIVHSENLTYTQMVHTLRTRFSRNISQQDAMARLRAYKQKHNQSFTHMRDEIEQLVRLAYTVIVVLKDKYVSSKSILWQPSWIKRLLAYYKS